MDQPKIAATGLILISLAFFLTHIPQEKTSEASVNATFSNNGSRVSWASLEVADNETERAEGLMNRTELGKHGGMLFIFPKEGPRAFWMKNTYIPLDMIFLNSEKEVLNVETAQPQPNTTVENLESYRSEGPARYVIEVNAGFAKNYSVEKGDKVKWK